MNNFFDTFRAFFKKTQHGAMSIQTKITLWSGVSFFLVAVLIIGYAATSLRNEAALSAEGKALDVANAQASDIQTVLERTLSAGQIFTQSVIVVKTEDVQLGRDQVNAMLRQILKDNPQFVGVDVLFEPNAFDGMDAEFAKTEGSDANGRFLPYWTRGANGEIQVELLQDYDVSDWYQCPKTTKVSCLIDPYIYPVQGQDIWMTSLVIPFVVDDTFYGITGIDTPVSFLQDFADSVDIFDGAGKVAIISNNGTLLGVTGQPELIGQPVTSLHEHFSTEDYQMIKNGKETLRYGSEKQELEVYVPIHVGETTTPWSVNVVIPRVAILADASKQMWRMIGVGSGLLVISLLVLSFVARQIAQPIRELTDVALKVADGDLDVAANIKSSDETGTLANAFNQMTTQLRELIASLEQRVADRTKELEDIQATVSKRAVELQAVADISTKASQATDVQEMLQTVVEETKKSYSLYHAHIYLLDESGTQLELAAGAGEVGRKMVGEKRKIALDHPHSLVARAARTIEGAISNDVSKEPDFLPNPLLPNTKAEMAIPVAVGERLLGVLDVQADYVNRFTDEDIAIKTTLAQQVAATLESIHQFETSQKVARELGVVANISTATAAISDANSLLQEVVDKTKEAFDLYHVHVYLLDEDGNVLKLASGAGEVGKQMVSEGRQIPLDSEKSLVARAARTRSGVTVNDVRADPDFLPNPLLPETRSEMAVPMIVGDKVVGVLDVQSEHLDRFTEIDINIKTTLAAQVAVALQNARSFAQARIQAEQEALLNTITQRIQGTTTVEAALQMTARELGLILGKRPTFVALDMPSLNKNGKTDASE